MSGKGNSEDQKEFNDLVVKDILSEYQIADNQAAELAEKIFETHKISVVGLRNKNGEVIQKSNEYRDRASMLQTELDDAKSKIESLNTRIKEQDDQINEMAKSKDVDVDEIVEKRVKAIREQSEHEVQAYSQKVTDLNIELDRVEREKMNQKRNFEIQKVTLALNIPEHAREDFENHVRPRFNEWDDETKSFVGKDPISGERIYNDNDPTQVASIYTYADKNLRGIRPHYFQNIPTNLGLNGNTQTHEDMSGFFNPTGTPTIAGFQHREKIGDEAFEKLKARWLKNKGI